MARSASSRHAPVTTDVSGANASGEAAPACRRLPTASVTDARPTTAEFAISTTSPFPRSRSDRASLAGRALRVIGNVYRKDWKIPLGTAVNLTGNVNRVFIMRELSSVWENIDLDRLIGRGF